MFAIRSSEMRKIDQFMIETIGVPSSVLMENAAKAVVEEVQQFLPLDSKGGRRITLFCGLGNNGGDGLAVARWLHHLGYAVMVVVLGEQDRMSKDTAVQFDILRHCEIDLVQICEGSEEVLTRIESMLEQSSLVIDGIYGSGCNRRISDFYHQIIERINHCRRPVFAIDVPSGIHSDNGKVMGNAVIAQRTITFCLPKIGLLIGEGPMYSGTIVVKDIGILEQALYEVKQPVDLLDEEYVIKNKMKLRRSMNTHKGNYGVVGVIAGTTHMQGASLLAAKAAYRAGAGLVKIFCQEEYKNVFLTELPEAVLVSYHQEELTKNNDSQETEEEIPPTLVEKFLDSVDVVLIGQGLSQNDSADYLLEHVLQSKKRVVLDADALNLLGKDMERFEKRQCEVIVTPHIGEMSRMTAYPASGILENTLQFAEAFSRKYKVVCVLKSHRTIIADQFGHCNININGNPGMATAGSGDVLAGTIVGLLAQGLNCEESACLGVSLHACSGDYLKARMGEQAIMASDLVRNLWKTQLDA